MKDMSKFEIEEIAKVVETVGISEKDLENNKSIYFDAWNFGKPKGTYEYVAGTVITEGAYVDFD